MRRHRLLSILLLTVGAGIGTMIGGLPEASTDLSVAVRGSTLTSPSTTAVAGDSVSAAEPVPPMRQPAELTVIVLNATNVRGAAGDLSQQIEDLGYRVLEPDNAPTQDATRVLHTAGLEREAKALAERLDPRPEVQAVADHAALPDVDDTDPDTETETDAGPEADLVVVIGSATSVTVTVTPSSTIPPSSSTTIAAA